MKTQSISMLGACLILSIPAALAHTWVEQLTVIAPNGTFAGTPGYSRGYMSREQGGFEDDMVYLLPPDGRANTLLPTDGICKSTQTIGNQTAGFPALVAAPGDNIALRYQENGHVTLPNTQIGKPANRGTVYIYGTTQPSNDDKILSIHKVWNAAGTGGDGRGVLLATRNFDDGQCYQVNGGNISDARQTEFPVDSSNPLMGVNLWCQTDVQLPSNVTSKSYSLYWVWDWPTAPNVTGSGEPDGKIEIYTSCMDINMTATTSASVKKQDAAPAFLKGQDLSNAAIAAQLGSANQFQVPVGAEGSSSVSSATASVSSTSTSAQSSASSVTSAVSTTVAQPTAPSAAVSMVTITSMVTVTAQGPAITVTVPAATVTVSANGQAAAGKPSVTPFQSTMTTVATSTVASTADNNGTTTSHKKLRSHIRRFHY